MREKSSPDDQSITDECVVAHDVEFLVVEVDANAVVGAGVVHHGVRI